MNFDRTTPEVPVEIIIDTVDSFITYYATVEELWEQVLDEMMCADYRNRSHHNTSTYDAGCRGPLCRKALREHPRRRANPVSANLREERVYDPVIEYFHVVVKHRIRTAQQELLKELA